MHFFAYQFSAWTKAVFSTQGAAQPNTCLLVTLRSTDLDAASQGMPCALSFLHPRPLDLRQPVRRISIDARGLETSSDAPQLRATYFSADVAVRREAAQSPPSVSS